MERRAEERLDEREHEGARREGRPGREPPAAAEPAREEHPERNEGEEHRHRSGRRKPRQEPRAVALAREPVPPLPPLGREAEGQAREPRRDESDQRQLEPA